jgi:hypothetical protein
VEEEMAGETRRSTNRRRRTGCAMGEILAWALLPNCSLYFRWVMNACQIWETSSLVMHLFLDICSLAYLFASN